jgi:hypothetical protein
METAIQVVWWIGLIGALVLTLVILKEVMLVLRVLRDIHQLAELTRTAARGVAGNVGEAPKLVEARDQAFRMRDSVHALARAAALIELKLGGLAGEPAPREE